VGRKMRQNGFAKQYENVIRSMEKEE